jgi:hypothetical protein
MECFGIINGYISNSIEFEGIKYKEYTWNVLGLLMG